MKQNSLRFIICKPKHYIQQYLRSTDKVLCLWKQNLSLLCYKFYAAFVPDFNAINLYILKLNVCTIYILHKLEKPWDMETYNFVQNSEDSRSINSSLSK